MKRILAFLITLLMLSLPFADALALQPTTLFNGSKGEEVRELQQALITLGFLKGTADGIFGNKTEQAVRQFQRKNKLNVDGLAGLRTRELIQSMAAGTGSSSGTSPSAPAASPEESGGTDPAPAAAGESPLFGDYSSMRIGSSGNRVKALQSALIKLKLLSGTADGKFGKKTYAAVVQFQKDHKLTQDGVAGKKTLKAIEQAIASLSGDTADPSPAPSSDPDTTPSVPTSSGPAVSSVQLLAWYDQVKPSLKGGNHLTVFDPATGISWTLRVLSCGRHCDAEPLTAADTQAMRQAFGGQTTWTPKPVYVLLPDGRWSLASTHDTPHDSSTIKDNDFNGHLCVHFLRTMEECSKNDPNYGVTNQNTIRAMWKSMTGQEITY